MRAHGAPLFATTNLRGPAALQLRRETKTKCAAHEIFCTARVRLCSSSFESMPRVRVYFDARVAQVNEIRRCVWV